MDAEAVRAWHDFSEWLGAKGGSSCLQSSMRAWLPPAGPNNVQPRYTWRGQWPASMQGREMVTMVSQGVQELTNSIPPASLEREFEVVTSMIDELNSNFAVELSIDIASVRNHHGSSEAFNCYESSTEKKN